MDTTTERCFQSDLAYLRLLHLADSALPIGSLAHSFGLETLVAHGFLTPDSLPGFLRAHIEELGAMEAAFCREAFRIAASPWGDHCRERWTSLNQRLSALKPARESRSGSAYLGQHLLSLALAITGLPVLKEALDVARNTGARVHHAPAFGFVAECLGVDEHSAVLAYLHQSIAGLISACQRLLPLGQTEATRLLWDLKPAIIDTAAARCSPDDVSSFTPLLDWAAMEHAALESRLFIS